MVPEITSYVSSWSKCRCMGTREPPGLKTRRTRVRAPPVIAEVSRISMESPFGKVHTLLIVGIAKFLGTDLASAGFHQTKRDRTSGQHDDFKKEPRMIEQTVQEIFLPQKCSHDNERVPNDHPDQTD